MTVALEAALATVVGADHVRPIPGQPALAVTPGSPTELADVVRLTADAACVATGQVVFVGAHARVVVQEVTQALSGNWLAQVR